MILESRDQFYTSIRREFVRHPHCTRRGHAALGEASREPRLPAVRVPRKFVYYYISWGKGADRAAACDWEYIMKARFGWILLVLAPFLGPIPGQAARAQQRGPSTPEERTRAVKVAHQLEEAPLAKEAQDNRQWVFQWIVDIPDITVSGCIEYFGKVPSPPRGHSKEIVQQMIISSAAFMIEHPDKAKDEQAVATAGLLGSLRAYQSIVKEEPDARWSFLEKIVQMRDQGKLDDYVTDTRRKCAQDEEQSDPDTIRAQANFALPRP